MHEAQQAVVKFHREVCEIERKELPGPLDPDRIELRAALIEEECAEAAEAIRNGDFLGTMKELCDILFVTYGAASEHGVDLSVFFNEVMRSNMTKKGGPVREDGKRLKPPWYEEADLQRVIETQDYGEPEEGICQNCGGEHLADDIDYSGCPSCRAVEPIMIACCPEHGLHGERTSCFVCGGPVTQVAMRPVS